MLRIAARRTVLYTSRSRFSCLPKFTPSLASTPYSPARHFNNPTTKSIETNPHKPEPEPTKPAQQLSDDKNIIEKTQHNESSGDHTKSDNLTSDDQKPLPRKNLPLRFADFCDPLLVVVAKHEKILKVIGGLGVLATGWYMRKLHKQAGVRDQELLELKKEVEARRIKEEKERDPVERARRTLAKEHVPEDPIDDDAYVVREELEQKIKKYASVAGNFVVLYGIKGSGKSAILNKCLEGVLPVKLTGTEDYDDIINAVLEKLVGAANVSSVDDKMAFLQKELRGAGERNGVPSIVTFQVHGTQDPEKIKRFSRRLAQVTRQVSTDSGKAASAFIDISDIQVADGLRKEDRSAFEHVNGMSRKPGGQAEQMLNKLGVETSSSDGKKAFEEVKEKLGTSPLMLEGYAKGGKKFTEEKLNEKRKKYDDLCEKLGDYKQALMNLKDGKDRSLFRKELGEKYSYEKMETDSVTSGLFYSDIKTGIIKFRDNSCRYIAEHPDWSPPKV